MKDSKYQIGDVVTIKDLSKEDVNTDTYRFGLNSDMVKASGTSHKIRVIEVARSSPGKVPDDGYRYSLEGPLGCWSWSSAMFEDPEDSVVQCITERDCSIDAFINKKKCPVLDFTLY